MLVPRFVAGGVLSHEGSSVTGMSKIKKRQDENRLPKLWSVSLHVYLQKRTGILLVPVQTNYLFTVPVAALIPLCPGLINFRLLGSVFQIASSPPTSETAIADRFDNLGFRCP